MTLKQIQKVFNIINKNKKSKILTMNFFNVLYLMFYIMLYFDH